MPWSGSATPSQDELVISGSPADGEFVAFSPREGRVQARKAVNTWDRMGELSALIRSGDQISGAGLGGSPRRDVTSGEAVLSFLWTAPVGGRHER
ncbi:hypothetical protein ACFV7R_32820 [Streptomyces sp. NPDC059866]|uniref:hypothetical protein n=1 Tax=Streptomyces sp. NPDC059866 TaxID=3346978 RepID=UPI0036476F2E